MILIVNVAEWRGKHLEQNFPCDCGQWFVDAFGKDHSRFVTWRPRIGQEYPTQKLDGVVISGSAASVYDDETWIHELANRIVEWDKEKLPILGVCFGHQLIAQVFGGKVEKNPLGWEVGTCKVELTKDGIHDPLFEGLPAHFSVMQSHQDIVTKLPPHAVCMASSDVCPFQSFKLHDHIRTVQFHPEYTVDQVKFIITPRQELLEAAGIDMKNTIDGLACTPESRTILTNFEHFFIQQQTTS